MRTNAIGITLALALTVGAASVAAAQQGSRPERPRVAQDSTFRRGPGGGMDAMLLRGITLSADQQQRLAALRATERQKMGAGPATARPPRVAGQRRDTTGMGERRARMEKMQEQHVAALKSILTTDQQAQLDRNLAAMKTRRAGRGEAGAAARSGMRPPQAERRRSADDARDHRRADGPRRSGSR